MPFLTLTGCTAPHCTAHTVPFYPMHRATQVVGSSILFVYDGDEAAGGVSVAAKMIDFAKTEGMPEGQQLSHCEEWELGNREDGYLTVNSHIRRHTSHRIASQHPATQHNTAQHSASQHSAQRNATQHHTGRAPARLCFPTGPG